MRVLFKAGSEFDEIFEGVGVSHVRDLFQTLEKKHPLSYSSMRLIQLLAKEDRWILAALEILITQFFRKWMDSNKQTM